MEATVDVWNNSDWQHCWNCWLWKNWSVILTYLISVAIQSLSSCIYDTCMYPFPCPSTNLNFIVFTIGIAVAQRLAPFGVARFLYCDVHGKSESGMIGNFLHSLVLS